eukprot:38500-Amphidinium_carterae.1
MLVPMLYRREMHSGVAMTTREHTDRTVFEQEVTTRAHTHTYTNRARLLKRSSNHSLNSKRVLNLASSQQNGEREHELAVPMKQAGVMCVTGAASNAYTDLGVYLLAKRPLASETSSYKSLETMALR